jgi:excisionase family DNA binding protein
MVMKENLSSNLNAAISALRGLAAEGYFNQEKLSAMEDVLLGKEEKPTLGKRWLTVPEACLHARVSRQTLWKYRHAGNLAIHRLGRRCLIEEGELDAFILAGLETIGELAPHTERQDGA